MAQQRKRTKTTSRTAAREEALAGAKARRTGDAPEKRTSVRRPSPSGPPVIVVVGGVLLIVAALMWGFLSGATAGAGAQANIDAARRTLTRGDTTASAEIKLQIAEKDKKLTKDQVRQIKEMRAEFKIIDADLLLAAENSVGTKYYQEKLVKYSNKHLAGDPGHPEARVFMERCKEFRSRWPKHPEMDWVDRNEKRFAGFIDLNTPPTWADMGWKLERLVHGTPKDYSQAFKALDTFVLTASDSDKILAKNRRGVMAEDRAAYFLDRMQQARFELKNGNKAESMRLLIYGIIYSGDKALEDEAASYLMNQENVTGVLQGYQDNRELVWARLKLHPTIADYIDAHQDKF